MRELLKPIQIGRQDSIDQKNSNEIEYYERQLLGFLLYNQSQIAKVKTHLVIDSFSILLHRKIYDACINIDAISDKLKNVVNLQSVDGLIDTHSEYAERGGFLYLAALQKDCYLSIDRLDAYVHIIKRYSARRRIVEIATNLDNAKLETSDALAYSIERINVIASGLNSTTTPNFLSGAERCKQANGPQYLINHWLPAKTFSIFYSPPGCGKSFVALDIAMHLASQQKTWHGNKVLGGDVVYLLGEGHDGFDRRLVAWCREKKISAEECRILISQKSWGLDIQEDVNEITEGIKKAQYAPKLMIVDTLNRFLVGSESDEESVKKALKLIDKLIKEFQCAVMLVHHTGWGDEGRIRGHSSWIGAADVSLKLARNADDQDLIELTAQKMKDDEIPSPMRFKLKRHLLTDMISNFGEPATAAVVEQVAAVHDSYIENCIARIKQACDYYSTKMLKFADLRTFLRDVDGLNDAQIDAEMLAKGDGLVGSLHKKGFLQLDNRYSKFVFNF